LSSRAVVGTILINELLVLVHVKMRIFLYYKNKSGFIDILKREIDTLSDSGLLIHDLFLRRLEISLLMQVVVVRFLSDAMLMLVVTKAMEYQLELLRMMDLRQILS
jgi:hypothetical protein